MFSYESSILTRSPFLKTLSAIEASFNLSTLLTSPPSIILLLFAFPRVGSTADDGVRDMIVRVCIAFLFVIHNKNIVVVIQICNREDVMIWMESMNLLYGLIFEMKGGNGTANRKL